MGLGLRVSSLGITGMVYYTATVDSIAKSLRSSHSRKA